MKTIKSVGVALFFLVSLTGMASPVLGVNVLATSHEIFYFKADKGWLGGEVQVLDENSQPVGVQKLDKKKMVIDFFDLAPGKYTIIIMKEDCGCHEEFTYIKK